MTFSNFQIVDNRIRHGGAKYAIKKLLFFSHEFLHSRNRHCKYFSALYNTLIFELNPKK